MTARARIGNDVWIEVGDATKAYKNGGPSLKVTVRTSLSEEGEARSLKWHERNILAAFVDWFRVSGWKIHHQDCNLNL